MKARSRRREGGFDTKPQKPSLFSFVAGQEWSSDSDDSDYEPGVVSYDGLVPVPVGVAKKVAKKRWKSRSPSNGKRSSNPRNGKRNSDHESEEVWLKPAEEGHRMWAEGLPTELLVMIFSTVVKDVGTLPFLCRASRVCRSWNEAIKDNRLWRNVDLASGRVKQVPNTLRWLVENRLARVTNLNMAWWKTLKFDDYRLLFRTCDQIRALNISHCKITSNTVKSLAELPNLHKLDISHSPDQIMLPSVLCPMLINLGTRLCELNISGNHIKGFNLVLRALMDNCPNLTLLDFSACQYASQSLLNVERLQQSCPRLRVLRLQNTKLSAGAATREALLNSPGFPELVEVDLSITDHRLYVGYGIASRFTYDDDFVIRVLKNSPKLEDLDVNMCIDISDTSLLFIPAIGIRHLRIARCSSGRLYAGVAEIVDKWKHSVESLDLSWNRYARGTLDQALIILAGSRSPVHSISLAGTNASCESIRSLLAGCSELTTLDLTSCRGLPRGVKRRYDGKRALDDLRGNLGQV